MERKLIVIFLCCLTLSACTTRSLSDSGYKRGGAITYSQQSGELDELAALGALLDEHYDDTKLTPYERSKEFGMEEGDSVMLIQSGSEYPDSELVSSLSKYWEVSTFSGNSQRYSDSTLNKQLRLLAASGGNDYLVICWGAIESANKGLYSKSISWVPIFGWMLPDEKTSIRAILKFAIIETSTGHWKVFQPEVIEEEFYSAIMGREGKVQAQEITLKQKLYNNAAEELFVYLNNIRG